LKKFSREEIQDAREYAKGVIQIPLRENRLDRSTVHPWPNARIEGKPRFFNQGKKRRFLRQAQDTEFIEVQIQP